LKPQTKAPAKHAKAASKAKAAPARKAVKPAAKAKPAPKTKPDVKKAATKVAARKVTAPAAKAKPAPRPASKAVKKTAAKTAAKKPLHVKTPTAPAKSAAAKTKTKAKTRAAPATKTAKISPASAPAPVRADAPRPMPVVQAGAPARATKPSARLAQITVPSMAQSVASTAAKSSYTHTMPPPVLPAPPMVAVKKDPKLANNWKTKSVDQLTDAEVMAMPDTEYMNDKQMAFFRLKLTELKTDILNSAGETTEHLREDTVIVPDPADRATIEEEHALELRTRDRERKLLKKIEQSIGRIDAGDYGYCDETGEPIGVGRLLARPTATLSLEAQQRRELKQKMFGD
jgi:DnaK suppressor protein